MRWTKDGEALDISTEQRLNVSLSANTSRLTLSNVVRADHGLYRCVANNSVNTATSDPGILIVYCEYFKVAIMLVLFSFGIY